MTRRLNSLAITIRDHVVAMHEHADQQNNTPMSPRIRTKPAARSRKIRPETPIQLVPAIKSDNPTTPIDNDPPKTPTVTSSTPTDTSSTPPTSLSAVKLAVNKAIDDLIKESEFGAVLLDHLDTIAVLQSRGLTEEHIAAALAKALQAPTASVLRFLRKHRPGQPAEGPEPTYVMPTSYETPVVPKRRVKGTRVHIPSADIRQAIQAIMTEKKIKVFRIGDKETVNEIVERVPALKTLENHERNRRIIDSCINRKHGPVCRSRDGQREIYLAA